MKFAARSTVVAVAAAAVLAMTGAPAFAADTAAPVLKAGPQAGFTLGSTVTDWDLLGTADKEDDYTDVSHSLEWSATDVGSGVCNYDLERVYAGTEPTTVFARSSATSFTDVLTNYNGDYGGGSQMQVGWRVTARDCAGNTSSVTYGGQPAVRQEDGSSTVYDVRPMTFSYGGTWSTSECTCASGGKQRATRASGASLTLEHSTDRGDYVGLVMAQGPGRGSAAVYVDGARVATVDTYAATNKNRVIVFKRWLSAGDHTIKVVNLATPGHPRIDVDAVLTSR